MATPAADFFAFGAAFNQLFLQIFPIGERQRLVEQACVVAGVVNDMSAQRFETQRVRHGTFADQIAPADFDFIDADFCGDGIEQPLAHEGGFIAARARDKCRTAFCW